MTNIFFSNVFPMDPVRSSLPNNSWQDFSSSTREIGHQRVPRHFLNIVYLESFLASQITDTKEVEAQRTMTSLMAASGAAHRTFTPNAHSRVSAVYRYAGPAAERKLGAAMVAAASKFGSQHQAEVRAALSEDISSPARRDVLRIALLGVS